MFSLYRLNSVTYRRLLVSPMTVFKCIILKCLEFAKRCAVVEKEPHIIIIVPATCGSLRAIWDIRKQWVGNYLSLRLFVSLSVSFCLFLSALSLSLSVSRCLFLFVSVCLSLSLRLFVCLSVSLRLFVSLCVHLCLFVCLSLRLFVSVCASLSICLSLFPSLCLCPFLSLSVALSLFLPLPRGPVPPHPPPASLSLLLSPALAPGPPLPPPRPPLPLSLPPELQNKSWDYPGKVLFKHYLRRRSVQAARSLGQSVSTTACFRSLSLSSLRRMIDFRVIL